MHTYVIMMLLVQLLHDKIMWVSCLLGNSTLREIFMKTDNFIEGKFFGSLIKVSDCVCTRHCDGGKNYP